VKAVGLRVHGRVQGVWFRASAVTEAEHLGLRGWVRNLSDGSVEAHVQGAAAAIDDLIAWCRVGPSGAEVTEVEVAATDSDDTLTSFRIR
jgi:acylphosphatase